LIAVGSVLATMMFVLWTMNDDTLLKIAATTFFTAATMFTLLLVTGAFLGDIIAAGIKFAGGIISGAPPP